MFAEVTNFSPPMEIGIWLACACFVIWFLLLLDKGIQRLRGKAPHPPNSQLEASQNELTRRVALLENLHAEFAGKKLFDEHVASNTRRHGELFARIEKVETVAREALQKEIAQINADRRQSLETINRKNERMMFALGKIAEKLKVDIEPTE